MRVNPTSPKQVCGTVLTGVGTLGLLVTTAVLLTTTACRTTKGTSVVSFPSQRITENSWLVANKLQVESVKKASVNGFLQVQVDAISLSSSDYQFEYRFRWLNQSGIEEEQGWANFRTAYATAKEPIHFQGVAPNTRVTDFEFLVRFPDRVMPDGTVPKSKLKLY
jgi:uncharacterized protein YcfL